MHPAPHRCSATRRVRRELSQRVRWLLGLVLSLAAIALLWLPSAGAHGGPPKIIRATATYHETTNKVAFSVELHRHPKKVTVFHAGKRLPASRRAHLQFWWQSKETSAPKRNCYRIRVKARNGHGLTTRSMRAGRIGSKGCR